MAETRRKLVLSLLASGAWAAAQDDVPELGRPRRRPDQPEEDDKLPNGKSRNDAIAKQQHEDALKDADQLVKLANQIRDEIKQAGNFVVPLTTLKKTEEAEKLAHKIHGKLKG